ncbi:transposase [Hydrogenibacillus sp. N12]|uniref:transposase n=1 Tax=Hydrogenibacillus sp. N12 TaxID=2866627 RepID=UPI001C7DDC51|nr:transposase [Hydrogenibacillus sp. N12]QZA32185.1 transposase [Hydrogenibacillus sp. N12]
MLLADLEEVVLSIDEHRFRGQAVVHGDRRLAREADSLLLPDDRLKTLEAFLKRLPESVRKKIWAVTIDLKESWKKRIQRILPEARVVADPFHVLQDVGRRVDEARRVEIRTGHRLPRRPLRKNEEDLTERKELATIRKHFRNVAQFHWVKEQLRDIFRTASYPL